MGILCISSIEKKAHKKETEEIDVANDLQRQQQGNIFDRKIEVSYWVFLHFRNQLLVSDLVKLHSGSLVPCTRYVHFLRRQVISMTLGETKKVRLVCPCPHILWRREEIR